ncbi:DUF2480 family protein [Rhodohalobacter sp.]|uniref:DUF2480 family protein n=1 Tax=Rhodohalobacter sp. TaxID=1974210 RepID=UPI002ACEB9A7|nr:DUF2480 family protein [Rhodohalobacter sp.]MDZ7757620.1 DUF2480 family protein [Rhodohalobacter sp.]
MSEIVNKVKQSKLETVDLEKLAAGIEVQELDIKDFLFQELILKEKEYREKLEQHDWSQYDGVYLAVFCSTDAILPKWAFMLIVQYAYDYAEDVLFGNGEEVMEQLLTKKLSEVDWKQYQDKFVLLKGCSKMDISSDVYMEATKKLLPHVKKLMYGEACSNVPIYRQKRS